MGKTGRTRKNAKKDTSSKNNEPKQMETDQDTAPDSLIDFESSSGTSTDEEVQLTSSKSGPPSNPKKKQRTFNENDMELILDKKSSEMSPSLQNKNDDQVEREIAAAASGSTGAVPNQSTVLPDDQSQFSSSKSTSLNAAIENLGAFLNQENTSNIVEPSNGDQNNTNQSRHANPSDDVNMEENHDIDHDDVPTFRAAVPFDDVKRDKETKKQLIARIENFLLDKFDSLTKVYYVKKLPTSNPYIVAIILNKDQHISLTSSAFDELKLSPEADTPIFHNYDPLAIMEDQKLKTLNVRNIPLRLNKLNIETYFKKFGLLESVKLRVVLNSPFQAAEVTFSDPAVIQNNFTRGRWGTFIMGECVRLYPACLTKAEHEGRNVFTAVLRNIPRNTHASDFIRIVSNSSAMAIGIPRTVNNYTKPWAYLNFKTETAMQAAMEVAPILNGKQLVWDSPDNVRNFCPKCSSPGHRAKDCDTFRSRGRNSTPKALIAQYKKFGIVTAATKHADQQRQQTRNRSSSKNRSRSRSRSNIRNSSSVNPSSSSSSSTNSNNKGKNVSYADAASGKGSNNLNNSIHAPKNINSKKNNQHNASTNDRFNQVLDTILQQITLVSSRILQWEKNHSLIEHRLQTIEQHLNITAPITPTVTTAPQQPLPVTPTVTTTPQQPLPVTTSSSSLSNTPPINPTSSPTVQSQAAEMNDLKGIVSSIHASIASLQEEHRAALNRKPINLSNPSHQ